MAGSDVCPVWLNQVVIGALPVSASRHNSPAHPHFLNKLVCSNLPCGDACIVVCNAVFLYIYIFYFKIIISRQYHSQADYDVQARIVKPLEVLVIYTLIAFFFKVVCERRDAFASACAIARAFPTYSRKSSKAKMPPKTVTVEFVLVGNNDPPISSEDAECMTVVAESIRLSARLVDMPCQEMHTGAFVEVSSFGSMSIAILLISGETHQSRVISSFDL